MNKGEILVREGKHGPVYALRFRAYGKRRFVTLGSARDGWTPSRADEELTYVLAQVKRGEWRPTTPAPVQTDEDQPEPTFHVFASEWLESRRPELAATTYEDYRWALVSHLLPFFKDHRLSEITIREVDRYRTVKLTEGALSPNTLNKTLTRLGQILAVAVEYDDIPLTANPAVGKRRRAKRTTPSRPWVEPEQLMIFIEAAGGERPLLGGRGKPLLAVLAGAGLRIDEALSLQRQHVNTAKGTLTVVRSKTEAGVRVVDLTPALRDELAEYLDKSAFKKPTDYVFPTARGRKDNRQNVRQRLFMKAIERANVTLAEKKIDLLGDVRPHGLRRTYASLRTACGDDVVFISGQIGHTDVRFTLNVYAKSVKRRERMTDTEKVEYDRAVEWASWAAPVVGTNGHKSASAAPVPQSDEVADYEKSPA